MQCIAVCGSVLQVLQCIAVCGSVLQCDAVYCLQEREVLSLISKMIFREDRLVLRYIYLVKELFTHLRAVSKYVN